MADLDATKRLLGRVALGIHHPAHLKLLETIEAAFCTYHSEPEPTPEPKPKIEAGALVKFLKGSGEQYRVITTASGFCFVRSLKDDRVWRFDAAELVVTTPAVVEVGDYVDNSIYGAGFVQRDCGGGRYSVRFERTDADCYRGVLTILMKAPPK